MLARCCNRLSKRYVEVPLSRQQVPFRLRNASSLQASQSRRSLHITTTHPKKFRAERPDFSANARRQQAQVKNKARNVERQQEYDETATTVAFDGALHKFPAVQLRDLCSCSLCIDQSTRQKLFVTADIPLDIRATDCNCGPEAAVISWKSDVPGYGSDHRTEIPLGTLRRLVRYGKPVGQPIVDQDLPQKVYWSSELYSRECSDIDYDSYMHDDNALLAALQQLEMYGLLFVHSVPEDEKSVETLAERIGPLKTTFYGRTWDVRSVPEAKNVAYTAQNLGFHMDLLYMEQPPHLQLLHCVRSSSAGGASLFTDSFTAVRDLYDLQRSQFNTLSQTKAAFHYDHPGSHYYHQFRSVIEQKPKQIDNFQAPVPAYTNIPSTTGAGRLARKIYRNPMDFVSAVAWSPPFQAPFALDRDIMPTAGQDATGRTHWNEVLGRDVQSWHKSAHTFNTLIHRPENIYERLMKPGECVIFDNRRVLHARKAFEVGDAGKERWLRGAYIDKDPYLSKLRILMAQTAELEGMMNAVPDEAEQGLPARHNARVRRHYAN